MNGKGIILKHDFLHIREIIHDVLNFTDDIFRTAQAIAMTVERLGINAEVTLCRTATSRENLNRGESCCRKNIVCHT